MQQGWHAKASVGLATLWPADARAGLARGFAVYEQGEREIESGLAVVDRACALLEGERPGSGLFLFVQIPDPHHPYEAHGSTSRTADLMVDGQIMTRLNTSDSCWWRGARQLAPGAHEIVLESETAFHLRRFELFLGGRPVKTQWSQHDPALATRELRNRVVVRAPKAQPAELRLWIHDAPSPEEIVQRYHLEVAAADAAVAELLAELDARGLYDSESDRLDRRPRRGAGRARGDRALTTPVRRALARTLGDQAARGSRQGGGAGHDDGGHRALDRRRSDRGRSPWTWRRSVAHRACRSSTGASAC